MSDAASISIDQGAQAKWHTTGEPHVAAEQDGLRLLAVPGRWNPDRSKIEGEFLRIVDTASGAVVGDFAEAMSNQQIAAHELPPETFGIAFGLPTSDHLLIIEPAGQRCRLAGGKWRDLDRMQSLIDEALAAMRANGPDDFSHSPDGRIRIDYAGRENRPCEWLQTPTIRNLEDGAIILERRDNIWDAHHRWLGGGRFTLVVRDYYMSEDLQVQFDVDERTVWVDEADKRPIRSAHSLIQSQIRAGQRSAAPVGTAKPPRDLFWWQMLVILLVCVALFYWLVIA